ncbi:MAG TPA: adenylate/guanylate cyclase domain-containing protein, partial [Candidatus Ozemobacteraceae bacterium]|nr:adenylate/guanylate cyclase domain-containing protein [Candidatus Ozemobacteraceae bacterium]
LNDQEIRFPAHLGIAGKVFTSGETINIPDAYADPRFNKEIDKKTGYHTRNILCMPVVNRAGKAIGVTQVLNKKAGVFTSIDEKTLKTFSAQAAIAIENAKLFDEVLNMKNYSESILESLSNGVITVNAARKIEKCNAVALKMFGVTTDQIIGRYADIFFTGDNHWIVDSLRRVVATQQADNFIDAEVIDKLGRHISINMAIAPLHDAQNKPMGGLMAFEDLTSEKRMKSTLSRYMNKEVADQLLNSDGMLGGKMQELTVVFSDIRNFTTISERLGAQETVAMLNEYFTTMVDIVFHHGGILDKFIGDAMLAVFGAPFTNTEDTDRAVITAIEMQRALKEFNRKRSEKGLQTIEIGVGINTDTVLVGNIGSLKRMDYTVIGDGVNLASRLEGANKFYGTSILISENSFKKLVYPHRTREVDLLRVKGKHLPAVIHEVLDHHDAHSFPHMDDVLGIYKSALESYRSRNWDAAGRLFADALKLHPGDTLSRTYSDRCAFFRREPPPDDWDGIWVMHSKS